MSRDQRLWVIRPGRGAELWPAFRDERIVGVGYSLDQSATDITTVDREELARVMRVVKPQYGEAGIGSMSRQVWAFVHEVGIGDLILVPRDRGQMVAAGWIAGECRRGRAVRAYVRPVEWITTALPAAALEPDLRQSLKSPQTFWEPRATDALARVQRVLGLTSEHPVRVIRETDASRPQFVPYRSARDEPRETDRVPFEVDPDEIDKATAAHGRIQNALARWLAERGLHPLSPAGGSAEADIAWFQGSTLYVAEVKSLKDANETRQLRLGLGQVLHYQATCEASGLDVRPVLVAERRPADEGWMRLCRAHGVVLVWPEVFEGLLE